MSLYLYHVPTFRSTRVLWLYMELSKLSPKAPNLILNEFVDVKSFRNIKPEWYLKLNVNGKVPVLYDENTNVTMFDSCAIVNYILDTYDKDGLLLSKTNAKDRALFHQLAFYCSGTLDNITATSSPYQRAVMSEKNKVATMEPIINPTNKIAWQTYISPFLESLLNDNDGGDFILGKKFTAADVILSHSLYGVDGKLTERGVDESWVNKQLTPKLHSYIKRVAAREARVSAYKSPLHWTQKERKSFSKVFPRIATPPTVSKL